MSVRNWAAGCYTAIKTALAAEYRNSSVGFVSTAVILLVAAGATVRLALAGEMGRVLSAVIHLLPAIVVTLDNLRWPAPHPDRWPRWLVVLSVAIAGTVVLHLFPDWRPASTVRAITTLLACVILIAAVLPRILVLLSKELGHIPFASAFLGRVLPAPTLYALILGTSCAALWAVLAGGSVDDPWTWVAGLVIAGAASLAVGFRRSLFGSREESLVVRALPHIPAWLCLLVLLTSFADQLLFFKGLFEPLVFYAILLLLPVASLVLAARKLRRSPVMDLPAPRADRPDSIQSKVEHYVDIHGMSARLVDSIRRSDAGVFGITGVRGAGKSALTRHVLATLARHHFTLEVTAPVRHDPDMGFFISVCRAVCAGTLDALEPIVTGARVSTGGKLWERLRNPLLAIVAAAAGFSVLGMLASSYVGRGSTVSAQFANPGAEVLDPLLGRVQQADGARVVVETERAIADHLLSQIALAGAGGGAGPQPAGRTPEYLLVPAATPGIFWLLRSVPDTDIPSQLQGYRRSLGEDFPYSYPRFLVNGARRFQPGYVYYYSRSRRQSTVLEENDAWTRSIFELIDMRAVSVPLGYLQSELRHHLLTAKAAPRALRRDANAKPAKKTASAPAAAADRPPEATPRPELLSQLILRAFDDGDALLAFDAARLREFGDAVQVYRRMLDGDVVPRVAPAPTPDSQSQAPAKSLSSLLVDPGNWQAIAFWAAVSGFLLLLVARPAWQTLSSLARAVANHRYLDLYAEATDFMEQLSYRSSQEMTAGLSWQGIGLGRKRTLAARDITLPSLTARYISFLAKLLTAYNGKVVIAIDELDKIHDPEQVKALLTEIKGALFVAGTYYLISISEDAARSFRRRLASGRDIFESTFDDIVEIRQMSVDAAVSMLEKLEEDVPQDERLARECLEVAALFGGGIPREIIRARRVLSNAVKQPAAATPSWAARMLLREDLDHWAGHLGETNLSGGDTIKVRRRAQEATAAFDAAAGPADPYAAVWDALLPCIDIIDPAGLRKSVGYMAEGADSPPGSERAAQNEGYRRIQSDLQAVLRLLILTHLSELILRPGVDRDAFEASILECHRALADKPALAETLLIELRSQNTCRVLGPGSDHGKSL